VSCTSSTTYFSLRDRPRYAGSEFARFGVPRQRAHLDRALFRPQGLGAVDYQIHHHLLDLTGIALDGGQALTQSQAQSHALRNRGVHQIRDLPHFGGKVQWFFMEAAAAQ
jgi:hypothetical protein